MNYSVCKNKIIVECKEFSPQEILECGQIFSYRKIGQFYFVYPGDKLAVIYFENGKNVIEILSGDVEFFVEFFDLETDYKKIQNDILQMDFEGFNKNIVKKALTFGNGIRILKQEVFETLISFIFSANNNIKRFTNSLEALRRENGKEIMSAKSEVSEICDILKKEKFYSFPTQNNLQKLEESYFKKIGAGYRAPYLVSTINKFESVLKDEYSTEELLKNLTNYKGVGRKVGECVLLFSLNRLDVFPVDTWIEKVYFEMTDCDKISREKISKNLVKKFGNLSGYIQQYLFYFKREQK